MSDFSDRPLVADSITGVRSFRVDSLGRLTGVSQREVWRPGVNEGKCRSSEGSFLFYPSSIYGSLAGRSMSVPLSRNVILGEPEERTANDDAVEPEHQVAQLGCGCGFYAYTDREANPYHDDSGNLIGIIRGAGVATVGSRGFRCESAEIVALVDRSLARKSRGAWDRSCLWSDAHAWLSIGLASTLSIFGLTFGITGGSSVSPWLFSLLVLLGAGIAVGVANFRGQDLRFQSSRGRLSSEQVALVRRNYPDVQWFPSVDAAVKAFPLSTPPPPPAPTPDDEDFWTRSAQ